MKVKSFKFNDIKTPKLKHEDENLAVSNKFIKTKLGIKHEILIENKQSKENNEHTDMQ